MIRSGKADGWLKLPTTALPAWALLNAVELRGIEIKPVLGHEDRGTAIVSKKSELSSSHNPLLVVPGDLVLSLKTIERQSRYDTQLQEVLAAVGGFSKTARGAILLFLLLQATRSYPHLRQPIGTPNQFTDYIKFLPLELLPIFWTDDERALMLGTSLAPATEAKLKSLNREYEMVRSATESIPWCQKIWWDAEGGLVSFDDWMQVDAMYRSRALEFPGIGDSMVPVIDMANHASGQGTGALYEADETGNGLLLLRDSKTMQEDEEVTITYGDEKGACEMLFSYGFIEEGMEDARDIFLDLDIPDDDPLKHAKRAASTSAPGFRLSNGAKGVQWDSEFVWIICVNEEDGLDFQVMETIDGERELKILWKEDILIDTSLLMKACQSDPLWEVFHLRAVSIVQDRIAQQLQALYDSSDGANSTNNNNTRHVRDGPRELSLRLRSLEGKLLERGYEHLEQEKVRLASTDVVVHYLSEVNTTASGKDFS